MWVRSLSQEDHLKKGMAAHSSILAWRTRCSLVGYRPWSHKELDATKQLNFHFHQVKDQIDDLDPLTSIY